MAVDRVVNEPAYPSMKQFRKFELKTFTNRGFKLTPVELEDVAPFAVKRMYYFQDASRGVQTGEHCHKLEEELFIQLRGSSAAIIDQGQGKEEIVMQGPGDAVYVPNFVWHGFKNMSPDSVILALSSTNYNSRREDYVEDYEEFKKISPYYANTRDRG